jgi:hypothetical protein
MPQVRIPNELIMSRCAFTQVSPVTHHATSRRIAEIASTPTGGAVLRMGGWMLVMILYKTEESSAFDSDSVTRPKI